MNAPVRVTAFVDGFNLYHAVDDLGKHHVKWLNLRALCEQFAPAPQFILSEVLYFSAFATWRVDAYKRHRRYVKALRSAGVAPVMGTFKLKDRACFTCGQKWQDPAGGKEYCRQMKLVHLERSLFGREVFDDAGQLVAVRPREYDPPQRGTST